MSVHHLLIMFGKQHTDAFIQHLQQQVKQLQEEVQWLQGLIVEKDEAFTKERQDLLNRLVGLPPQANGESLSEDGAEPVSFESRTARMLREQKQRQQEEYEQFLVAQGKRDQGLEQFRAEIKAELAAEVTG